ncbi:MAG: ABC transporter ATP-binding protein [Treponema sp.]|nr:ABC transporter ATP-binding protein [Treponema sp.]
MKNNNVLELNDFSLSFLMKGRNAYAVKDLSLSVAKGEIVGFVGESGCGKTLTALSCMGLQPEHAEITGSIKVCGNEIKNFSEKEWTSFRGKKVSMIFQEPISSLNPLEKIGKQIIETGILHGLSKAEAKQRALYLMGELNLADKEKLFYMYPHQLSGGQCQRVMIASALMNNPELLIADEPTTALDAATQVQIINLLKKINSLFHTAILFVSHDILLVQKLCTKIYIMYAGCILECGRTEEVLTNPVHPYTKALLNSLPSYEKRFQDLQVISGFVPPITSRKADLSYLFERWKEAQNICYIKKNTKPSETDDDDFLSHKVYCHRHNRLEFI